MFHCEGWSKPKVEVKVTESVFEVDVEVNLEKPVYRIEDLTTWRMGRVVWLADHVYKRIHHAVKASPEAQLYEANSTLSMKS